jgi:hypothetical protein
MKTFAHKSFTLFFFAVLASLREKKTGSREVREGRKEIIRTVLVVFLLTSATFGQELSGLDIAKKTIAASGGDTWRSPKTLHLSGTATLIWNGVEHRLNNYRMWRVFPGANDDARNANGKVRFDAFDGDKLFFQIAFDGKNTIQNLSDIAKVNEETLRWGKNFGFSIFRFVESPGFNVERLPDDKVDGHACHFIKIIDAKKGETIFGVDAKTFYIRAAFFKTPVGFHQRFYDDFVWVKGVKFIQPRSLRIFNDGIKTADVSWEKFKVNEPIDDSVFAIRN